MIDGTGMCGGCRVMIGDIMTGSATVILAMGAGRRAAKSIHEYLTTGEW
jgi:NADPH-dependent glutamate synthase beta subunit-like oxidoreductase